MPLAPPLCRTGGGPSAWKPTSLVLAQTRSPDSKRGGKTLQCGETPQERGLGAATHWSHDPGACRFFFPHLSLILVKWG